MRTITENHNKSLCQIVKPSPSGYTYKILPHLRLGDHCRRSARWIISAVWLCFLGMSMATYTHKTSPTWLPKHELNKDSNRHANINSGKSKTPQAYSKTCRQGRNAASGRSNHPFCKSSYTFIGRFHALPVSCQCGLITFILYPPSSVPPSLLLLLPTLPLPCSHHCLVTHKFNQCCLCDHGSAATKRSPVGSQVGTEVKTVTFFPFWNWSVYSSLVWTGRAQKHLPYLWVVAAKSCLVQVQCRQLLPCAHSSYGSEDRMQPPFTLFPNLYFPSASSSMILSKHQRDANNVLFRIKNAQHSRSQFHTKFRLSFQGIYRYVSG